MLLVWIALEKDISVSIRLLQARYENGRVVVWESTIFNEVLDGCVFVAHLGHFVDEHFLHGSEMLVSFLSALAIALERLLRLKLPFYFLFLVCLFW